MPADLKPFRVKYRGGSGDERDVVVFAYDEKTARSRAVHEGAVDSIDQITGVDSIGAEEAGRIQSVRLKAAGKTERRKV